MSIKEFDVTLAGGRTLHVYDTDAGGAADQLTVLWHHGTPNLGTPPAPLFPAAERLGIRWVSYDRPGYGGSTREPGRTLSSAGAYAARVADALGIDRFAVMGHSGGASHALACAAVSPERVRAVLAVAPMAPMAPYEADGLDWFAGMYHGGQQSLRAAAEGREAKERHEAQAEFDPQMFGPADHAALGGTWSWFDSVVGPALAQGPGGLIDDDLGYVTPWGCDPAQVSAPVLLLHGDQDRVAPSSYARWLARRCPEAELRLSPGDGHISILDSAEAGLDWLRATAR